MQSGTVSATTLWWEVCYVTVYFENPSYFEMFSVSFIKIALKYQIKEQNGFDIYILNISNTSHVIFPDKDY